MEDHQDGHDFAKAQGTQPFSLAAVHQKCRPELECKGLAEIVNLAFPYPELRLVTVSS